MLFAYYQSFDNFLLVLSALPKITIFKFSKLTNYLEVFINKIIHIFYHFCTDNL